MKNIAKILLIVLTAISVYVILYVGLGIGYPIGVSDNYEQINEVLENLSYSYLAGCIFYILTVTIPAKVRRHKLDSVLHSKIGVIVGKIRDSKQCVRTLVELQNNTFFQIQICYQEWKQTLFQLLLLWHSSMVAVAQ